MTIALQPPPVNTPLAKKDGQVENLWSRFFVNAQTTVTLDCAPADARYVVATSNPSLTAEINLGALSAGYLKQTVAAGVASPSTTATIPAADIVAAGSDTEVQINAGGTLGSTSLLTIDAPNSAVDLHGALVSDADILTLGLADAPTAGQRIQPAASTGVDQDGASLTLFGGVPTGSGAGGGFTMRGGNAITGDGAEIDVNGGQAGGGGSVFIAPGADGGGGADGTIDLQNASGASRLAITNTAVVAAVPLTAPAFSGDGAALTALTGTNVTYQVVTKVFADSPYTVLSSDFSVLVDATGGAVTVTLPTPTSGRILCVKKTDATAAVVTLTGTVDGVVNPTLGTQFQTRVVQGDGSSWQILSAYL